MRMKKTTTRSHFDRICTTSPRRHAGSSRQPRPDPNYKTHRIFRTLSRSRTSRAPEGSRLLSTQAAERAAPEVPLQSPDFRTVSVAPLFSFFLARIKRQTQGQTRTTRILQINVYLRSVLSFGILLLSLKCKVRFLLLFFNIVIVNEKFFFVCVCLVIWMIPCSSCPRLKSASGQSTKKVEIINHRTNPSIYRKSTYQMCQPLFNQPTNQPINVLRINHRPDPNQPTINQSIVNQLTSQSMYQPPNPSINLQ